jgi:hypothetical protein
VRFVAVPPRGAPYQSDILEAEMSKKLLIAAAAAVLVASTGLASAQPGSHTRRQAPRAYVQTPYAQAPYADPYYDESYWSAVASHLYVRPDPFVGTIWEGVVSYYERPGGWAAPAAGFVRSFYRLRCPHAQLAAATGGRQFLVAARDFA